MASRVCIGCGLTTDDQNRLIVNTGGTAWPYTCSDADGAPIYCGSDGVLRAMPEKFQIRNVQYSANLSGTADSATFGSPSPGAGSNNDFGTGLEYVLDNPSDCLPMTVAVTFGVEHVGVQKVGAGNADVIYGAHMSSMGDIVTTGNDAHQRWAHNGSVTSIRWDAMGSTRTKVYTLAAGGSVTFTVQPYTQLVSYSGGAVLNITNYEAVLDVQAWN